MRLLLVAIGWLMVALGVAGIFLPLVPTVPFLLLASACFARGSPRLHAWLEAHPFLGLPLRTFRRLRKGAIGALPRKTRLGRGGPVATGTFSSPRNGV